MISSGTVSLAQNGGSWLRVNLTRNARNARITALEQGDLPLI